MVATPTTGTIYDSIRQHIAALIRTVDPDIGAVYDRIRWANNWVTFLNLFKHTMSDGSGDRILGWFLTRVHVDVDLPNSRFGGYTRNHGILIRGIMGFSAEHDSDGHFQDLVDKVINILDADNNLLEASNITQGPGPVQ